MSSPNFAHANCQLFQCCDIVSISVPAVRRCAHLSIARSCFTRRLPMHANCIAYLPSPSQSKTRPRALLGSRSSRTAAAARTDPIAAIASLLLLPEATVGGARSSTRFSEVDSSQDSKVYTAGFQVMLWTSKNCCRAVCRKNTFLDSLRTYAKRDHDTGH